MANFEMRLTATDTRPAYEVLVNDGGPDGGSTSQLYVGGDPGSIPPGDLDAAVQAFADSLGSIGSYSVVGIKRLTVTGASL